MYAFEKDIIEFMNHTHGKEGVDVIKYLMKNGTATDSEISEHLKIRENIVRRILYDLHDYNAVELSKRKIGEGRMYEFKWSINYDAFYRAIIAFYEKKKEELQKGIDFLSGVELYSCGNPTHPALTMDEAFEYDFKCPLCGKILHPVNETERIKELKKDYAEIDEKISKIKHHFKTYRKKKLSKK